MNLYILQEQLQKLQKLRKVPEGQIGLYRVAVGAGVTSITNSDLTRIAPTKPDILVGSHRTLNPIDHPDACIFDQHIARYSCN